MPHNNDVLFKSAAGFEVLDTSCDNDDVWLTKAVIELKGLGTSEMAAVKDRVTLVQVDDFDLVVFS